MFTYYNYICKFCRKPLTSISNRFHNIKLVCDVCESREFEVPVTCTRSDEVPCFLLMKERGDLIVCVDDLRFRKSKKCNYAVFNLTEVYEDWVRKNLERFDLHPNVISSFLKEKSSGVS